MEFNNTDALLIIDVQNDFCPGGTMGVRAGDEVAATMNNLAEVFSSVGAAVFTTQDWHPSEHSSFTSKCGRWPAHCIQGTKGAERHPYLKPPQGSHFVKKGASVDKDAYSGFVDSDLAQQLNQIGICRVFVGGIATDYGVLNTVIDALELGFETYVLTDAVASIDVEPNDGLRALHLMEGSGATLVTTSQVRAKT